MPPNEFQEELKFVIGNVIEKIKRFAIASMKKCQVFKSFEQKHSNSFITKNIPREMTKKVLQNIKTCKLDQVAPGNNANRLKADWLTKVFYDNDLSHYDELKAAIIEKLKDIREYDLEMIYEKSRDELTKDLDPRN